MSSEILASYTFKQLKAWWIITINFVIIFLQCKFSVFQSLDTLFCVCLCKIFWLINLNLKCGRLPHRYVIVLQSPQYIFEHSNINPRKKKKILCISYFCKISSVFRSFEIYCDATYLSFVFADVSFSLLIWIGNAGVSPTAIAVQSPYVAQVQLLRDKLDEFPEAAGTEVATIDSFQGREADAVILSMVWSKSNLLIHHFQQISGW